MILKILRVNSGYAELTNCYIVQDEETKETMVIDPGGEASKISDMLNILGKPVLHILALPEYVLLLQYFEALQMFEHRARYVCY